MQTLDVNHSSPQWLTRALRLALRLGGPVVTLLCLWAMSPEAESAKAQSPLKTSQKLIWSLLELAETQRISGDGDGALVRAKSEEIASMVDTHRLGQLSMGSHWRSMSDEQKKDFVSLLQSLFEELLYPRASQIQSDKDELKFEELSAENVRVSGMLERELKGDIVVNDFEIILHVAAGRVSDATIEGERVSENLRRQLNRALETQSFEELMERMRNRLKSARETSKKRATAS